MSHPRWPGPSPVDLVRLARSLAMGRVEAADDARRDAARRDDRRCRAAGGARERSSSSQLLVVYHWLTRGLRHVRRARKVSVRGRAHVRDRDTDFGSSHGAPARVPLVPRRDNWNGRRTRVVNRTRSNNRESPSGAGSPRGAGVSLTNRTTRIYLPDFASFRISPDGHWPPEEAARRALSDCSA